MNVPAVNQPGLQQWALVIPVFDDWATVAALLAEIDQTASLVDTTFHAILVNDGSYAPDRHEFDPAGYRRIPCIETLNLVCNLGHQRAIAVGLVAAAALPHVAGVVVMDGDGEDRPKDIPVLLRAAAQPPGYIICARRRERSEPRLFRVSYWAYKVIFRVLTGNVIAFGNFCLIRRSALNNVIHNPATWNHLAASILQSRIPVIGADTIRGRRLAGETKMNFISLLLHGMSAISVYAELVMIRIVLATLGIAGLTVVGIAIVTSVRLFTSYAIPGWASTVFGSLAVILTQLLVFATIAAFTLLNARSTKPTIPALDAMQFVESHEVASPETVHATGNIP